MTFLQTPEFKVGLMVVVVSGLIGVMSLKVAEGFNGSNFIKQYNNIGLQVRNLSIQLQVALDSYKYLIGKDFIG